MSTGVSTLSPASPAGSPHTAAAAIRSAAIRAFLIALLYFPTHTLSLDTTPEWDFDEGGLMNIGVELAETGHLRYPLMFRTPEGHGRRPTIYGPGHFAPLGWWLKAVGISGVAGRAFSVLVTFFAVWVLAEIAYLLGGPVGAGATAILLCTSLHFHALARFIRPEPSQVLWQAVALWACLHAWQHRHAARWWVLAGAAAATSILSHYLALWVGAVVGVALTLAYWGRWHRSRGWWAGLASLTLPLVVYVWWLGKEDFALLRHLLEVYPQIKTGQAKMGMLAQFAANIRCDLADRLPLLEAGGTGFWGLRLSPTIVWWHRLWLGVGAVGPLIIWPVAWLKPGSRRPLGPLGLLACATGFGILYQLVVYPNKQLIYLPGALAYAYCGAGVALGMAWQRWGRRPVGVGLLALWLVAAASAGSSWVRYSWSEARALTPFTAFGQALNAITPRNADVYGRGTWWLWFRPRPFTAAGVFPPASNFDWLPGSVRACSPRRNVLERAWESWTWTTPDPEWDRARQAALEADWTGRPELGAVVAYPYGCVQVYGPRFLTGPLPRPAPVTLVFYRDRCFQLLPYPDGTRTAAWTATTTAPGFTWTPTAPAQEESGTLEVAQDFPVAWGDRLLAPTAHLPAGIQGIRVRLLVEGAARVRYGFAPRNVWAAPVLDLIPSDRPYTIASVAYVSPAVAPPFVLWVLPDGDASAPAATVRILSAEFMMAEAIDPATYGAGDLLAPAWRELPAHPD